MTSSDNASSSLAPISLLAPMKINLCLHVGAVASDGLHQLASLAVFGDVGDRLTITTSDIYGLDITGPYGAALKNLPIENNLITKAVKALAQKIDGADKFHISLEKNLPPASGLGGGTMDAAAALIAIAKLHPEISHSIFVDIMTALGSDGPLCLAAFDKSNAKTRSYIMRDTGARVLPGPQMPQIFLCVANPGIEVSTQEIFAAFDMAGPSHPLGLPSTGPVLDVAGLSAFLGKTRNDLQPVAEEHYPVIGDLQRLMAASEGCLMARMTGSGASVFGVFATREAAVAAAGGLKPVAPFAEAVGIYSP
jgi:4-diphosphocytidyl-2-C-methyl-D-erythritol kinase